MPFITLQISLGRLGGTAAFCMAELFSKSRVVMVCCSHRLRAKLPLTSGTGVLVAMSVDHSPPQKPLPAEARPVFLGLQPGMTVIVRHDPMPGEPRERDWWMGQVIHCEGGARDPKAWSMFQIADVDSGVIRWVNGDLVTHVLPGGSAAAPADRCSG